MRNLLLIILWNFSFSDSISVAVGFANTGPPMGWSSYGKFGCNRDCNQKPNDCIGEKLVKRTVDAMISKGFHTLGYRNLALDGCWSSDARNSLTKINDISPSQFPSGIPSLANHVRSHGMKLGLLFVEDCKDSNTIAKDAEYAHKLGIDFIRHYSCSPGSVGQLRTELDKHSKSTQILCAGGWISQAFRADPQKIDWANLQRSCAMWRTTDWADDSWTTMISVIKSWASQNQLMREKSGPGHWADLITVTIHNSKLNEAEKRTNMGMWCLMSSPLFFSDDMDTMDDFTYQLLTNEKLIAIDQDPSAPATYNGTYSGIQVWVRKLSKTNNWVIGLLNENDNERLMELKLNKFLTGIPADSKNHFELTDVFNGVSRGSIDSHTPFKVRIRAHDTEIFSVHY